MFGAAGYLYGNRIVLMKEDTVSFPANFRDLGHISFSKDSLDAKAMDVLKALIGARALSERILQVVTLGWRT
jgi:hypothetical protein